MGGCVCVCVIMTIFKSIRLGVFKSIRLAIFNFPDNWKLSDEELEALDYEDDD
jgi:hypothetical protein